MYIRLCKGTKADEQARYKPKCLFDCPRHFHSLYTTTLNTSDANPSHLELLKRKLFPFRPYVLNPFGCISKLSYSPTTRRRLNSTARSANPEPGDMDRSSDQEMSYIEYKELTARHETAKKNLALKLACWPKYMPKPTIKDVYFHPEKLVLPTIPRDLQLEWFFKWYNEIGRWKYTVYRDLQDFPITRGIFYYGLDEKRAFTHHFRNIRYNVVMMVLAVATDFQCAKFKSYPQIHDFVWTFLMAFVEGMVDYENDFRIRDKFIKLWKSSIVDFTIFFDASAVKMQKLVKKLGEVYTPQDPEQIIKECRKMVRKRKPFPSYGPAMALRLCIAQEEEERKEQETATQVGGSGTRTSILAIRTRSFQNQDVGMQNDDIHQSLSTQDKPHLPLSSANNRPKVFTPWPQYNATPIKEDDSGALREPQQNKAEENQSHTAEPLIPFLDLWNVNWGDPILQYVLLDIDLSPIKHIQGQMPLSSYRRPPGWLTKRGFNKLIDSGLVEKHLGVLLKK